MVTELDQEAWLDVLSNEEVTRPEDRLILRVLHSFKDHQAAGSQLAQALGHTSHGSINLWVARYAKRIAKSYPITLDVRNNGKLRCWNLFFEGFDNDDATRFIWKMKASLVTAFETLELEDDKPIIAEEISVAASRTISEGAKRTITVNLYERSHVARHTCIAYWGTSCTVCGFNFEAHYGKVGEGFIHVHHLIPLSSIGDTYELNPVEDLRPVCPNCHAMLHKKNPPYDIEDLKDIKKIHDMKNKNAELA
jgi:5-methylcytosine-specific restriction protein A